MGHKEKRGIHKRHPHGGGDEPVPVFKLDIPELAVILKPLWRMVKKSESGITIDKGGRQVRIVGDNIPLNNPSALFRIYPGPVVKSHVNPQIKEDDKQNR